MIRSRSNRFDGRRPLIDLDMPFNAAMNSYRFPRPIQHSTKPSARSARSVGELLIVLALLCVLLAIALPWMQRSREQSRRVHCQVNLKRIGEALQSYHAGYGFYPAGVVTQDVPVCNDQVGFDHNWITGILDELALSESASWLDRSSSVYTEINRPVLDMSVSTLRCPSLRDEQTNLTCYAGSVGSLNRPINTDMNGVFYVDSFIRDEDVLDGLDYTVFVGEKLPLPDDAGWISGTRASLRSGGTPINVPIDPANVTACETGGFGSAHVGGAYLMMGSGRWTFVSEDIDPTMYNQMTSRNDSSNSFADDAKSAEEIDPDPPLADREKTPAQNR